MNVNKGFATLAALCASVFVVGTSEYLIAGLLPQVGADLDVSVGTAGQAVTAYALGVVAGGPVMALLTARLPRKGLAIGLMLLFAAGSAISAVAPSFGLLLVGRVVSSLSHAVFLALALVTATRVVPSEKTGSAIATVASGFTVATLLGVPLGALLGQSAGWRAPFAVLTALSLAGVVLLAAVLPRQEAPTTRLRDEVRVVTRRPVLLAIVTTAVGFSGVATVFTYIAPLLTRVSGFSTAAVSGLLLAYGAGSFLGNLTAGRLTDRSMSATVRGVFGGLTGTLLLIPFAAVWQPTAVVVVLVLGLLATATIAPLQGLILHHAGAAPTLAVAANVGAFNLGAAAGSVVGGAIVAAGALRWTGLAGAVLSLIGLALTYLVLPRTRTPARDAEPEVSIAA
ncbi:MFS transporter, DHA1 family, inner membrane transport protein [Nonomuraea solani]|uniref:MFS transporter, DHA1 family, inner membrane transport protein n=1 Tax=Nonomuraea solani TaxID=1144553 RepID=A0A1H5Y7P8_9ACTN|nr:MFS transporter [Nonomuraea solani]SEG20043.1 MFS transporter, DHA1 family, inner membrane transport protein [Nonomuraea solani]